jgi:hypothetical protein
MFKHGRLLSFLVAPLMVLGACDGSTGSDTSRVTINLTDAPADLTEAWVEIEQIYLQGSGGRVVLRDESTGLIDLLTLTNDVVAIVDGAIVPSGTYSELRFVIGDAYIRTNSGAVYAKPGTSLPAGTTATGTLQCPSCAQTGIKVKFAGGGVTLDDDAEILVVDFDVSQSFGRQAGASGQWVMHPVLTGADFTTTGSIAGTVALADGVTLPAACGGDDVSLSHFVPRAIVGADTVASGAVEASGDYRIRFLAPGTYALGHAPTLTFENGESLAFAATAAPASVSVSSGTSASADFTITSATCQ